MFPFIMSWNDLSTGTPKPDHRAGNQLLARLVSTLWSHRGPSLHGSVGFVPGRNRNRCKLAAGGGSLERTRLWSGVFGAWELR